MFSICGILPVKSKSREKSCIAKSLIKRPANWSPSILLMIGEQRNNMVFHSAKNIIWPTMKCVQRWKMQIRKQNARRTRKNCNIASFMICSSCSNLWNVRYYQLLRPLGFRPYRHHLLLLHHLHHHPKDKSMVKIVALMLSIRFLWKFLLLPNKIRD